MDRKQLNEKVCEIVRGHVNASDQDVAHVIEEALFQIRASLARSETVDLDYLGHLYFGTQDYAGAHASFSHNLFATPAVIVYDPRFGAEGYDDQEDAA